ATLLAYLVEGSGSRHFETFRKSMHHRDAEEALHRLAEVTRAYLRMQIEAGVDAVQLFDSWAGLVSTPQFEVSVAPAARAALQGLEAPGIYFAPAAAHLLDRF